MIDKSEEKSRKRISIDGVWTTFLDTGCGREIVALHGVPTSSALFEPLLPYLHDCRVIAPDLLGQGGSDAPAGWLDYAAYRKHLTSFLGTVPSPAFDLIVHDLGGVLGLDWAAEHTHRVRSLIILSTAVTWSFRVGFLLHAANLVFGRAWLRHAMTLTLKRRSTIEPSLLDVWAAPWTRWRIVRSHDLFAPAHLARVRAGLGRIHTPALLIWGVEDDIFPLSFAREIVERMPQARLVTLPRCGHWSPLDASEDVARQVVEFLSQSR